MGGSLGSALPAGGVATQVIHGQDDNVRSLDSIEEAVGETLKQSSTNAADQRTTQPWVSKDTLQYSVQFLEKFFPESFSLQFVVLETTSLRASSSYW